VQSEDELNIFYLAVLKSISINCILSMVAILLSQTIFRISILDICKNKEEGKIIRRTIISKCKVGHRYFVDYTV
jgi:hypothetical protein